MSFLMQLASQDERTRFLIRDEYTNLYYKWTLAQSLYFNVYNSPYDQNIQILESIAYEQYLQRELSDALAMVVAVGQVNNNHNIKADKSRNNYIMFVLNETFISVVSNIILSYTTPYEI